MSGFTFNKIRGIPVVVHLIGIGSLVLSWHLIIKMPIQLLRYFWSDEVHGAGHASFTTSPDGTEDWIAYHAKVDTAPGWKSTVQLKPFTWQRIDTDLNFGVIREPFIVWAPVPLMVRTQER